MSRKMRSPIWSTVALLSLTSPQLISMSSPCFPADAVRERLLTQHFASACPECHGLGRVFEVSEQTLVPDPSLTNRERAVAAWPTAWQG